MGYGAYSLQDAVEMAEKSTENVQYLLGAIGGVALLVAAIGIMNTMMMSIFERTKEIGIIKVLGCRIDNIAGLFLAEAGYIGLFGGALGMALSFGISALLNVFLASSGLRSIIPAYLVFGAVGFSIIVAVAAGMYPAVRAMKLSPLAAIRNE
jgi:ABC-type antimicrobial peptide transport system permease subunit